MDNPDRQILLIRGHKESSVSRVGANTRQKHDWTEEETDLDIVVDSSAINTKKFPKKNKLC
jgi:hypothetical protein